jgi:hypothetical protein
MSLIKFLIPFCIWIYILSISSQAQNIGGCGPVDYYYAKVLNEKGQLDSWHKDQDGPFHSLIQLSADWWKKAPEVCNWPIWCTAAEVDRTYQSFNGAIPGSACSFAILTCLKYYTYTGDPAFLNMAIQTGDYIITCDLTPAKGNYPKFPYAVGKTADVHPNGSGHPAYDQKYNPQGHIQPDKGAMLGYALLKLYQVTGKRSYLKVAVNIADCLSNNAVEGTADKSPWPMRVMPENNTPIDGRFAANVSFACRLFDGLLEIGVKGNGKYRITRDNVWNWLKKEIISFDDGSKWEDFFEDHSGNEVNSTQLNALETVRYLLEKKESADPDWFNLSGKIIRQVLQRWALTTMQEQGYICIAEQDKDRSPYNSHTARLGSILAMYYEAGGGKELKDVAYSSLCYGVYSIEDDGFTCTYYKKDKRAWTSDSFGDFLGHYLDAFAAVPEWAGAGNHLLHSTSTIKNIVYSKNQITYSAFGNSGKEQFKLQARPHAITVSGKTMHDFSWDEESKVLQITRHKGSNVTIKVEDAK